MQIFQMFWTVAGALLSGGGFLSSVGHSSEPVELRELIESRIQEESPGLAVAMLEDGRVVFECTRGLANLETRASITPHTQFYLASVSKPFTAVAIAMLEEQGLLHYDETLAAIFGDLPPRLRGITLDQMLRHTSGLGDYLAEPFPPQTNEEVLQRTRELNVLFFPPGTDFRYSNTGYNLLATCVQTVSRQSFPEFMRKEIFLPQKMANTLVCTSLRQLDANRAVGYLSHGSGFATWDYSLRTFGDGGIFSTLDDMKNWCRALEKQAVLRPKNQDQLFKPVALPNGKTPGYGRGWFVAETEDGKCIQHGGSLAGYRTNLAWYPEFKIWIVLLANRNDLNLDALSRKLFQNYRTARIKEPSDPIHGSWPEVSSGDRRNRLRVQEMQSPCPR